MDQASVPWDPIPEPKNSVWNLEVLSFQEMRLIPSNRVVVVLEWREEGEDHQLLRTRWRITFDGVSAYRMTSSADWFKRLKLDYPYPDRATWELTSSQWLDEVVQSNDPQPMHHFAIVTVGPCEGTMYELAAHKWRVETLPVEEAQRQPLAQRVLRRVFLAS